MTDSTHHTLDIDHTNSRLNYSQFDLELNPFPYSPAANASPDLYFGQPEVVRTIEQTIRSVLESEKSRHLVVTGSYGNGKSHTLRYAESHLRDNPDAFVGYVQQPGEGLADLYREFMHNVTRDRVEDLVYEYLGEIIKDRTERNFITADITKNLIDDGSVLLSDLIPEAIDRLSDLMQYPDFARALVHLVYNETSLYAWQWLTGEGIRYEQRKDMEIHGALDDGAIVRAFTAFTNLLRALDFKGVFLFVDEFERVGRLSPTDTQAVLGGLRHLFDQNPEGLCTFFGCAPEVWQQVASEYHAFAERIAEEVSLRPLTVEEVESLIIQYLELAREENETSVSTPFNDEAIETIHERSDGNIRRVLSISSRALDTAARQSRSEIDSETVIDAL